MVRDLQNDAWTAPASSLGDAGLPVRRHSHDDCRNWSAFLSFQNVKDYEDYIRALEADAALRSTRRSIQMRKGMAEGLMPARILLEQVVTSPKRLATQTAGETVPSLQPFAKFPDGHQRGRSEAPARCRHRGDSRFDPARVREVHQVRERGVRAERPHRTWRLGASRMAPNGTRSS